MAAASQTGPAIASNYYHTCVLTSGGGVKCWGDNGTGQLGDGTTTDRWTPVDVTGLASGVSALAPGSNHSCALMSGGGVKCWGLNTYGQLGDGTTTQRLTPVDVVGLAGGVSALASGSNNACALTSTGVKCWGLNTYGQLGDGTTTDRHTPVDVMGLASGVSALAVGGNYFSCALMSGGGVKCWGLNTYGQLGDGTTTDRHTPVDVMGLASGVSALAVGGLHSCALMSGGSIQCWGSNGSGQLGDGTTTDRHTPVDVMGLASGVSALAGGYHHTCALTSTGVKCWGGNYYAQLGDGTTTDRLTPVDVVGLASGVSALAAGVDHTCALMSGGGVKCWGLNFLGDLGDGTTTQRLTPVDVVGLGSRYSSGPPVDPNNSVISVQPGSLPANGTTSAIVTIQLLSASNQPSWGKTVQLNSSRGALDYITQAASPTGGDGRTTAIIRSSSVGVSSLSAYVLDDGVNLTLPAIVTFTTYTPPAGDFLLGLNQLVDQADQSFAEITEDAQAIASDGTYFRQAIGKDTANLAVHAVSNMATVMGGINDTARLQKAARLACAGCYLPGSWNVQFSYNHPLASQLLDTGFTKIEDAPAQKIAEFLGFGGPEFYAHYIDKTLGKADEWAAEQAMGTIFVNLNDGMNTIAYPGVLNTASDLTALLNEQRNNLLANLPAMTPEFQSAYQGDLVGRQHALIVLGNQLRPNQDSLYNFHFARENDVAPGLLDFLLRDGAEWTARGYFHGPGTVAVGGTLLLFDGYMDTNTLSESAWAYNLAVGSLSGAPDALRQVYTTAYTAMDHIARGLPANRATGEILSVANFSQGSGFFGRWNESASWTEVSVHNSGSTEATFRVRTNYVADTSRFGVPWATMSLFEEPTITLAPGASSTVRVDYKRANGTRGISPRTPTCLPIVGCTQPSPIYIDVLATNESGTYYIGYAASTWNPTQVSSSGARLQRAASNTVTIDPPLTSYVLTAPWYQKYQGQLWIDNPFTTTVSFTVTQTLTQGITVLDTGGASLSANTLSWNTTVSPSALSVVTFTFGFAAPAGTINNLPSAVLGFNNPADGQLLTTTSNSPTFFAVWPLTLERAIPGYLNPNSSSSALVTVTNWLPSNALTGTVTISVTDLAANTLYSQGQIFNTPVGLSSGLAFTLTGLPRGNYLVQGLVSTGGVSTGAFVQPLQVGLPAPSMAYRSSVIGVVHPGDVLTYTFRFTNTTGVMLSTAVLTASLPMSTSVVAGSVSGGGNIQSGQVQWPLGTVAAGQYVSQSFAVVINADATRLLSQPTLSAVEIMPALGPLVWNLVLSQKKTYVPLIRR